ncbi:chloride channel protein [candidate division KSB1 bacterium]|nr:chloride channel protein [candidate division KSB1 bacterium]RQW00312.1 MAG: chloride channel protein [candidate division KSB1 bacterium]
MNLSSHFQRLVKKYINHATGRLFLISVIVGIVSGVGAILFFEALGQLSHVVLQLGANYFAPEPMGEMSGHTAAGGPIRWWILLIAPALGGLISGFLVFTWAPEAEGHGTDAMIEAFHHKRGLIRKRVPIIKAIASIITIGTGGSAGREGPIAQIGAGFGSYIANVFKLSDEERRFLLLAGAAGGIGAIFRSPLGGALFVVEVLYKRDFEERALVPALISAIVAYSIFASRFGWGHLFKTPLYTFSNPVELVFYGVFGVLCAGIGVFYIKIFYGLRDRLFHRIALPPQLKPAIGGLFVGIIGAAAPFVLASGYGYLQQAMNGELTIHFMMIAMFLKILTTSFTISSGGSGGVFAPSLFIGGMLGGVFGQTCAMFFPDLISNPTAFVLVGMGAFFAGAANVPISSMIMVSEMTGGYYLLVPMMLSSSTAYLATSRTTLYEKQVNRIADSPAHLGDFTVDVLDSMIVEHAFHPIDNIPTVRQNTPLSKVQMLFSERSENFIPVLDKSDFIVGIISLRNAKSLLFDGHVDELFIAQDLMTPPVTVTPAENLKSALKKFIKYNYSQIPVVDYRDERKILGLVTQEDVIQAYNNEIKKRKFSF